MRVPKQVQHTTQKNTEKYQIRASIKLDRGKHDRRKKE